MSTGRGDFQRLSWFLLPPAVWRENIRREIASLPIGILKAYLVLTRPSYSVSRKPVSEVERGQRDFVGIFPVR